MSHPNLEKLAEELYESFINGNRSDVFDTIAALKADQAALVMAKMCTLLDPTDLLACFQVRVKEDLKSDDGEDEKE